MTFLLLLPGVPVWALTASDTTRPAQAQDPLPGAQRAAGGATNPGVTVARSDASGWAAPYPTGFSLFLELPTGLREQGKNDKLTLLSIFVSLRKLC
ncbi:hypothetical protein CPA58_27415 [Klebsiella pneumoniae]|nr:hypothetical protein CPA58_27415 [Klebsiella pneumoniae]